MTAKTLKDRIKETNISFLEIERQTGVKANRMYKWYQQDTNPKKEDADKLEEWLINLEKGTNSSQLNEPMAMYGNQSILNLTESNRVLAESNKRMVDSILEKITLLDYIKTNLDKLPDSMVRLTGTAVEKQAEATQLLLNEFEAIKRLITDASTSGHKKPLRNQKH